ncbi:MAG TPA: Hpt domain-containing protein, partial [Bacteroidia bacterium]|nr:Hpt domain-containing protein [Bacteroidia bacterium]
VDLAYLEKITKGNEQFLLSMIDIFLEQNPEDVNMLRNAVRDADFETIRLISHKIKTSVVFIGLDKHIQSQLAEMEKLGTEAQQLGEIKKLFAEVDHVCGKADQELKIIKSERKK